MPTEHEIDWTREWRQEGRQQGQREMLLKQARTRFDDDTAETLALLLKDVTDNEIFTDIGISIITSDDKNTFLAQVKARLNGINDPNRSNQPSERS